ncbi:MAG: CDP-tyvelose epimerase, partial [Verrucomicrobia bacterium]|nr:CDP-tyvelose epimerase [Verrucomicrobiota bacterium]
RDLGALIRKQLEHPAQGEQPRTVNVAGGLGNSMSLRELSAWCAERFHARTVQPDVAPRPFDVPWLVLDTTLAQQNWDWSPSVNLATILEQIAGHAESNPNWLTYSQGS